MKSRTLSSLAPIIRADTEILILGTMPGALSLEKGEYYAHPRNRFWAVMQQVAGVDPTAPYPLRCQALLRARIGLWDVLATCEREGSLDRRIRAQAKDANDLSSLWVTAPALHTIAFNGTTAGELFRRFIHPAGPSLARLRLVDLPSTSPANTTFRASALAQRWRTLLA